MTSCGCTGIRNCLICQPSRFREDKITHIVCLGCGAIHTTDQTCTCLGKSEVTYILDDSLRNLFPVDNTMNGLSLVIVPEFISADEEQSIVAEIDQTPWVESQSGRRKQDYGPKANFKKRLVDIKCFSGLPPFSEIIVQRMKHIANPITGKTDLLADFEQVELCNLDYEPERGACIEFHKDDEWLWGKRLVTLNLLSDTYLSFTPPTSDNAPIVSVPLPRRSLVIVDNDARYVWKHAILPDHINTRRIACTIRELSDIILQESPESCNQLIEFGKNFDGVARVH